MELEKVAGIVEIRRYDQAFGMLGVAWCVDEMELGRCDQAFGMFVDLVSWCSAGILELRR